jgi:hypothetical protein
MIVSYLKYRRKAQGKYHLHSPLVFSLYEEVLEKPQAELDANLKAFINNNPLIFKDDDLVMIVQGIHRNKNNEAYWDKLRNDAKVRLSIDCWSYGLAFVMERIEKEHYILKI